VDGAQRDRLAQRRAAAQPAPVPRSPPARCATTPALRHQCGLRVDAARVGSRSTGLLAQHTPAGAARGAGCAEGLRAAPSDERCAAAGTSPAQPS
jgi:hypothetical protein